MEDTSAPPTDGSFMEWFKKQKEEKEQKNSETSTISSLNSGQGLSLKLAKPVVPAAEIRKNQSAIWDSDSDDEVPNPSKAKNVVKSEQVAQPAPTTTTSAPQGAACKEEGLSPQLEADIDKVAAYIAQRGTEVAQSLHGQYSFLSAGQLGYARYLERLQHFTNLQAAFEAAKAKAAAAAAALTAGQGVKRSSRWGLDGESTRGLDVLSGATLTKKAKCSDGYDSDEEKERALALHRKRLEEMQQTEDQARHLTEAAHGKHHIADFLPKEELDRFMRKADAVKSKGSTSFDDSDYQQNKIGEDNIGYKLLQKTGWTQGQGLGVQGQGITAPVGRTITGSAGLGVEKPDDIKEADDEFELYRKRMMLAYRYRPNPLNNPRRAYY